MVLTSMLLSCNVNNEKEQQSLAEVTKQELATALNERDQLLSLVKEVSAGLNEIKQLENIMTIAANKQYENPGQKPGSWLILQVSKRKSNSVRPTWMIWKANSRNRPSTARELQRNNQGTQNTD